MGKKRDYLRDFEQLIPNGLSGYFKVLMRAQDTVLMSMRAVFMQTVDVHDDRLFNIDDFWRFSSSWKSSIFSQFDTFIIDVLNHTPDFNRQVEKVKECSATTESAIIEVFLHEIFKDRPVKDGPTANRYYRSFVSWLNGKYTTRFSRPVLYVAHKVNTDSWLADHEIQLFESSAETMKLLMSSFFVFLRDRCYTALDRQLALFLEKHLLERTALIPFKEVEAELKRYRYDSNLSERELRLRLDFIRRKFISFLLTEGFHEKLPPSLYDIRTLDGWDKRLMNMAKVDDLSHAKALVERGPDLVESPPSLPNGSLRGLARHFRLFGIKTKESRRDDSEVLELWYSFGLPDHVDKPVTVVWPDGTFTDSITGKTGNIKEYL